MDKKWYIIHTYSGHENKVKANLEKRIESMDMKDKIFCVLIPTEEEIEIKGGQKKVTQKKVFPGYVLVEMIMTDDSWYVVRNTPGVTGFVGSGKPIPLTEKEVNAIIKKSDEDQVQVVIDFSEGESIRVKSGPFESFMGIVKEVYPEKGKVKVVVSMFEREIPMELDIAQVEKMS
ncbi:TPA: transcription termination/antitermination protein NusG [Candidatus Micrarchaeota archaeon]|nr:transcription termination/antitermination protein NusG [Candidatus Micrarchaeota archaeon]